MLVDNFHSKILDIIDSIEVKVVSDRNKSPWRCVQADLQETFVVVPNMNGVKLNITFIMKSIKKSIYHSTLTHARETFFAEIKEKQ